jgi:hypothetical protein
MPLRRHRRPRSSKWRLEVPQSPVFPCDADGRATAPPKLGTSCPRPDDDAEHQDEDLVTSIRRVVPKRCKDDIVVGGGPPPRRQRLRAGCTRIHGTMQKVAAGAGLGGSLADIAAAHPNVRFTPESGHYRKPLSCPLRAITGLMHRSNCALFDDLVGAGEQRRWYG